MYLLNQYGHMALHAVDDLSDALAGTREFLFPFSWGRWLRLAFISLFVAGGSGGGTPPNSFQYTMEAPSAVGPQFPTRLPALEPIVQQNLALIVILVGLVFFVSLVLAWLASTLEFALLESLRSDAVHVRQYVSDFTGLGTRLFAFRLVFGLGLLLFFGGLVLAVVGPAILYGSTTPLYLLLVLAPVFFVVGVVATVVYVLTTAFVAPIMLLEDRGVISAWRRFWRTLKAEWMQFLVYLLVGLFVMIAIGIGIGIVSAIVGFVVAIPFGVVFFLFFVGGGGVNPLALAILGIPLALLFFVAMAFVQVPVQVYLRYWALLVLGDVDSDLDLIPEQRSAIRGSDGTPSGTGAT